MTTPDTMRHAVDTKGVRSSAVHHAESVTLTIEIPADALQIETDADRYGLWAAIITTAVPALNAPQSGSLRILKGGRA